MHKSYTNYSVKENIQNWILITFFLVLTVFAMPFEDPMIVWLLGISLGYMTMWAQEIFYHWIESKH